MRLPSRPSTYIMTLLLLVLIALVGYMAHVVSSPELEAAMKRARERRAAQGESAH